MSDNPTPNATPRAATFANRKGGVGKTMLSINTAERLANHGHDVLLVDADPAGNATEGVGLADEYEEAEAHFGDYLDDAAAFDDVVRSTEWFDVLYSHRDLADKERELDSKDKLAVLRLKRQVTDEFLGDRYDYIIYDAPAATGSLLSDATILASQNIVVPMAPGEESIRGFEQMVKQQVSPLRDHMDIDILALVPNLLESDGETVDLLEQINSGFPELVPEFASMDVVESDDRLPGIRKRVDIRRAWKNGVPVAEYDPECDQLPHLNTVARIVEQGGVSDE